MKNINYSQFTNLVYITKEQITALNSNINKTLSFGNFIKLALEKIKNSGLWNEILSDDLKIIIELYKNKSSSTLLNSFFIKDILKTLELYRNKNSCKTIDSYLFEGENINKFDVLASQNISKIFDSFDMDYFPNGAWPSKFPLMFSQQFAINEILKRFKSTDTIYSINGPPGTGKTTLLKDLIAAIITQRAQILANLQSNEIFTAIKDEKDMLKFYDLNDELKGYEIVVASSNNSAVENISLEIPGLDEVDKDCLCEFDYFKELSDRLINKPCWGLISVKLGKLANKSSFVYDFLRNSLQKATKPTEFSDDMIKIEIENAEEKYHLLGFSNYLKKTNFMSFEEAKAEFKIALNKVLDIKQNIKSKKQILDDYPNRIKEIDNELSKLSQKYNGELNFDLLINKNNQKIDRLQNQIDNLKIIQNSLIDDKKFYINSKPFLYFVHKFFNTQMYKKFIKQYEILNEKINGICTEISLAQKELLDCECLAENTEFDTDKFKKLQAQKIEFSDDYNEAKSYFEIHFLQDQETRQKSSPFMKENGVKKSEFFKARTALFLKALKLHKAAIYENKDKICKNFNLIDKMFSYNADFESSFNPKEKLLLWQNLFFVTPVVSSTFSAFSTCFSSFDMSDIGYLLIDEAGQATIPSGVGALLRSKRVAILGDPLQIEPVVTLGNDLNEIFLTKMGVKEEFNLAQTSIQKRGDKIEINGTSIKQGGSEIWVGSPLIVHKRCNEPMFGISNKIAYNNMMILDKDIHDTGLKSHWIDVSSEENDFRGNLSIKESECLKSLLNNELKNIKNKKSKISIISPFRDVVNGLNNALKDLDIGTIHTMQGKQKDIIILVLGGGNGGARNWAAQKPNLLNVALTRAKENIFIIGDKQKWGVLPYFKEALFQLESDKI